MNLKTYLFVFFFLNIHTAFIYEINAQKLHLEIKGKDTLPKKTLDSLYSGGSFSDYVSLKKEINLLHSILSKIGYIENEILTIDKKNDSSFVATYFFGTRYHTINVQYLKEDFSKKELLQISDKVTDSYFSLPFIMIEDALQKLTITKTKDGNTFSRIHLENISKDKKNTLKANLIISNSKVRTISNIIVKGYDKFPKSYLKYYTGIKKGSVFDKEKIKAQSEALNNLGFVSNIKPPEILFEKDSTTVYLYLKKQKDNIFDGVLGFSNNEESQKLVLNGYLNLELNNNLNFGEQFLLNYRADGEDQQNFRVKLTLPYLLKSPFGVGLELKIFKRDTTFSTTEQEVRVNYQISPSSNSYIGYKKYESNNLRKEDLENLAIENYDSKFLQAGLSYTILQNSDLFPIKSLFEINTELGTREANKKESQLKATSLLFYTFNLNYKNSIFLKSKTKILISETFLTNELFRFGGINSIRGFNENSIDASFFSVLNTEYRYQFNKGTYMHSIVDVAYFENQIIHLKKKLYSFGIGVGLQTRAGILKFSIVNGNTESQDFNFSNTKIHISISSVF